MSERTTTRHRNPVGVTPEAVIAAALTLLDEVGPRAFTMRALAARLGTYANTIYWHVGGRDRVLALAVSRVLADIVVPDPGTLPARAWLETVAHRYRRIHHAHPNVAPLTGSFLLASPPAVALLEQVLTVLESMGFQGEALVDAYNAFVGSLVGWVALELATEPDDDGDWRAAYEATIRDLPPKEFPTITRNVDLLADQAFALRWHSGTSHPMDHAFQTTLTLWLDALEQAPPT